MDANDANLEDFIINFHNKNDTDDGFDVVNIVPHKNFGPNTLFILEKLKEFREKQKTIQREGGNHLCPGKTSENPEVSVIQDTESEIQKDLDILNSQRTFLGKLRLNRPSVFEEQPVAISNKLPVFLGKEYFKFLPTDSETSSNETEITETTEITNDRSADDSRDNLSSRSTKEVYLNFSHNDINYTFPFETNAKHSGITLRA